MNDQSKPETAARVGRSRLLRDKLAARVVGAGGVAIIAAILGIMLFLLVEVLPLWGGGRGEVAALAPVDGARAGFLDEYQTLVAAVTDQPAPRAVVRQLADGSEVASAPLPSERLLGAVADSASGLLAGLGSDGKVCAVAVDFAIDFVGATRRTTAKLTPPATLGFGSGEVQQWCVARDAQGAFTAAARLADGNLVVARQELERNEMTEETTAVERRLPPVPVPPLRALCLDQGGRQLYAATDAGALLWWQVGPSGLTPGKVAPRADATPSALQVLFGDISLLVGTERGEIEQWFPVRDAQQVPELRLVRTFPSLPASVRSFARSTRSKAFAAMADDGTVATYFATTGQQRWVGSTGIAAAGAITMTARGDALLALGAKGQMVRVSLRDPHPEPSLAAVTKPVHYESYDAPELKWESTPATDAAEPKLSVTPLVFGTLKATLFCLLLSVPLAVLAALYVSQFMHARVRAWVKPTVELMAALPSVVLGFVAAVWLAPLLEHGFPTLLLALILVPVAIVAAGLVAGALPERMRQRVPRGLEVIGLMLVIVATWGLCALVAPWLDAHLFGHDFPTFVRESLGLDYQQKNAVVVAIAMAFAVIPIVFSIAEDAFSNVPRALISASLALGANRWQTAARVVLPTASPGVFSAVMIGFGRAIGETMIVLMAVGATAIIDWNPFNGFRSLSANIAIEIGEAEHGGSLYRLLFVTALVLFALTFAVNTVAEIVRHRLRKRYATL